jgi:phosphorylcholine metabolism protein LicD
MRPSSHTQFKDKNIDTAYELLFDVCDLLDAEGVPWHLEGGTLLGLVRDGQLLPWDHDLDISVPSYAAGKLRQALRKLPKKWRLSFRRFETDTDMWRQQDLRLVKIKNRHLFFMPGDHCLDVFIKYEHQGACYWQAGGYIMQADARHYQGCDPLDFNGRRLCLPRSHEDYLSAKYGDWKTPDRNWDISREQTICSDKLTPG